MGKTAQSFKGSCAVQHTLNCWRVLEQSVSLCTPTEARPYPSCTSPEALACVSWPPVQVPSGTLSRELKRNPSPGQSLALRGRATCRALQDPRGPFTPSSDSGLCDFPLGFQPPSTGFGALSFCINPDSAGYGG